MGDVMSSCRACCSVAGCQRLAARANGIVMAPSAAAPNRRRRDGELTGRGRAIMRLASNENYSHCSARCLSSGPWCQRIFWWAGESERQQSLSREPIVPFAVCGLNAGIVAARSCPPPQRRAHWLIQRERPADMTLQPCSAPLAIDACLRRPVTSINQAARAAQRHVCRICPAAGH